MNERAKERVLVDPQKKCRGGSVSKAIREA